MHIKTISTYQFRNLEDQTVSLAPGVNFFLGKNGQGKTNIIEAISILSRGKSFRTSKTREIIKAGSREASVFASITNQDQQFSLGIAFKEEGRDFFYNQDKLSSIKGYLGRLLSISFSPDDLGLIKGGPQERRAFLDRHISDVNHKYLDNLLEYQRALKNKSKLLKSSHNLSREEIMPWNIILSRTGAFISQKRIEFCELLESRVERFYRIFSNDDSRISLVVKSSIRRENSVTEEKYLGELEKAVQREILMKTCLAGVHRDELEVTLNAKPSRIFSSQGESRSLVLAMKLAALEIIESDKGERPLLLLDDVDSELDRYRRRALLDIAFEKDRQIVITGTQLPVLESELASDCLIFEVSGGKIQQKTASQSFTL